VPFDYEYLHPFPDKLAEKPLDAGVIIHSINSELKLFPSVVNVNNARGSVIVTFTEELERKEKKALDDWTKKYFQEHK